MKYKKMDQFVEFSELAELMKFAAAAIDGFPDDKQYTKEELAIMEDLRHEAVKIKFNVEAAIQTFEGIVGERP